MDPDAGFKWCRATGYTLLGADYVAPKQEADLNVYQPKERDPEERVYYDFLNLDASDPQAVRDWCDQYGLLGILPHLTVAVYLWPRWVSGSDEEALKLTQPFYQNIRGKLIRPDGTSLSASELVGIDPAEASKDKTPSWSALQTLRQTSVFDPTLKMPHVQLVDPWQDPKQGGLGEIQTANLSVGYVPYFPYVDGVRAHNDQLMNRAAQLETGVGSTAGSSNQTGDVRDITLEQHEFPLPFEETFFAEYGEPLTRFQRFHKRFRTLARQLVKGTSSARRKILHQTFRQLLLETSPSPIYESVADKKSLPDGKLDPDPEYVRDLIESRIKELNMKASMGERDEDLIRSMVHQLKEKKKRLESWLDESEDSDESSMSTHDLPPYFRDDESLSWAVGKDCSSLLGMMVFQLFEDFATKQGASPQQCHKSGCEKFFPARRYNTRYCSEKHRKAGEQRRRRARQDQQESWAAFLEENAPTVYECWPRISDSDKLSLPHRVAPGTISQHEWELIRQWTQQQIDEDATYADINVEDLLEEANAQLNSD